MMTATGTAPPATTDGLALASGYLDRVLAAGLSTDELTAAAAADDLLRMEYRGPFLANPLFLGAEEVRDIASGVRATADALCGVVDWGFGGDLTALADAAGLTDAQRRCLGGPGDPVPVVPPLGRADLMASTAGFQLLELNLSSAVGGAENILIGRLMLQHPMLAAYASEQGLECVDTVTGLIDTLMALTDGHLDDDGPLALVDWPQDFARKAPALRQLADALGERGCAATACHVGQLRRRNHRLWLSGQSRPIGAVLRFFQLEDVVTPADLVLVQPLLETVRAGRVRMLSPLESDLFGSKGAVASLSSVDAGRGGAPTAATRMLPWTRWLTAELDHPDGGAGQAVAVATDLQDDLVLKPAMASGGTGVVAGWTVSADQWRAEVARSVGGPYVLQRRVRPRPEPVLEEGGRLGARYVNWGVFLVDRASHGGYGGCWVRASAQADVGVLSLDRGVVHTGCVLASTAEAREGAAEGSGATAR